MVAPGGWSGWKWGVASSSSSAFVTGILDRPFRYLIRNACGVATLQRTFVRLIIRNEFAPEFVEGAAVDPRARLPHEV
jgi:hypothetical protein